jgi:hypothetical protein
MAIKLSLEEMCYLVALFGDITMDHRERLFSVSAYPVQAGPMVAQAGYDFIHLNNGRIVPLARRRRKGQDRPKMERLLEIITG